MALLVKNPPANARDAGDTGSIPGSGRTPGEGNGKPLQCSCLENPVDNPEDPLTAHTPAVYAMAPQDTSLSLGSGVCWSLLGCRLTFFVITAMEAALFYSRGCARMLFQRQPSQVLVLDGLYCIICESACPVPQVSNASALLRVTDEPFGRDE